MDSQVLLILKADSVSCCRSSDPDEVFDGFILPRELALETLYTLQILFPHDTQTTKLIAKLVSTEGFDPNVGKHNTNGTDDNGIELKGEQKEAQKWKYWGSRMLDLYEELQNERPHGTWDVWVERNSKNRHVMIATIIGVFIAVLLGLLSLGLAGLQTWIAYSDWKSPAD